MPAHFFQTTRRRRFSSFPAPSGFDTITPVGRTTPDAPMDTPDLWLAFRDGEVAETTHGPIMLRREPVAPLVLTTGKVVACDALAPEEEPFTVSLPAGTHPVVLTVGRYADGDERVVFAAVRVTPAEPERWELALRPGDRLGSLQPGQYFGYPVDSGTGCFMDAAAAKVLADRLDRDPGYPDALAGELKKHYTHTWDWAAVRPDDRSPANVVMFSSGVGDGLYATFVGRDAAGDVVCLLTDFNVLDVA